MHLPLFELDNINTLKSTFADKPSIILRYSLHKFENNLNPAIKKEILNEVERSFSNCGSFDQFNQIFQMKNENNSYQIPLISNYLKDRIKFEKEEIHFKFFSHLGKANFLIQNYLKSNKNDESIKKEIINEINLGFNSLTLEGGPHFSQGFTSVIQSIIYGQKLIELKEMISSNSEENNLRLRFLNSSKIINFFPQIYLMTMPSIGKINDSFIDKLDLLSFCRKNNQWKLIDIIYNYFYNIKDSIPVEIQYEMMYNKIYNDSTDEKEIDNLINLINETKNSDDLNKLRNEYNQENLLNFAKYQKSLFILRNETKNLSKLEKIIDLCQSFNDADAIDLCGLCNLRIFELTNDTTMLNESIKCFIKSSLMNEKARISNILVIIYLLFNYYNTDDDDDLNEITINQIIESLDKIPYHFYIDLMSQFISYIINLKNNLFSDYILNLLSEIIIKYPQGVIYDYSLSLFSDKRLNGLEMIESPISFIKDSIQNENIQNIFYEVELLTLNLIDVNAAISTEIDDNNIFLISPGLKEDKKIDKTKTKNDLFLLSPRLKGNRDMSLPVFGTYHYNEEIIYIHEFSSNFKPIKSLQNPKKIYVIGSDGKEYPFIMKEKEDLRTDQRVMIFQKFLNQHLNTKIKTYSVIPLTSNQGLIQFVQETIGISRLIEFYRKKVAPSEWDYEMNYINNLYRSDQDYIYSYDLLTSLQHLEIFKDIISNEQRGNDLRNCFWYFTTSSEKWLNFISNFTSSCAVTSTISYIIGLGDRHLKNIMINRDNGTLMNIDFNDVFEITQKRDAMPEMVPFRLTRNLVAALGPSGPNGCFLNYLMETLAVMRENKDKIMKILKVFVDSPIQKNNSYNIDSLIRHEIEVNDIREFARESLIRINKKLNGTDVYIIYSKDEDLDDVEKMSVHEHAKKLIEFATNENNYCLHYTEWEPWK